MKNGQMGFCRSRFVLFARGAVLAAAIAAMQTGCGGGGGTSGNGGGGGGGSSPAPTASISVSPTSITTGSAATLTWSSTNTAACTASGAWAGAQPIAGTQSTGPINTAGSETYNLTCTGGGGSAFSSATLTISSAAAAPTVNLSASPATVVLGQPASLSWSSSNATSCTASGAWTGTEITSGSQFTDSSVGTGTYSYTLSCSGAGGSTSSSTTVTVQPGPTVWVPDFYDHLVRVYFGDPANKPAPVTLALPAECDPNSLAIDSNPTYKARLYIACTGTDEVLVYDHSSYELIKQTAAGMEVPTGLTPKVIKDGKFNGLIGMAFDATHDLWVASNTAPETINAGTPQQTTQYGAVLMIPAGTGGTALDSGAPASVVSLPASPTCPAGLVFDTAGGLWVTGSLDDANSCAASNEDDVILLHFPMSQLSQGAGATPDYCITSDTGAGGGCEVLGQNGVATVSGTPADWEGVALFNSKIWISNNGGGAAGYYLYSFNTNGGTLNPDTAIGTTGGGPITCPGGLFGGVQYLWINDESYGDTNKSCGADPADQVTNGGGAGSVLYLTAAQIATPASIGPGAVTGYLTGRPGFGGIYVENDD